MKHEQFLLPIHQELIVDLFAGAGGASLGIEKATGQYIDVAVNHNPIALNLHQANHPQTQHLVSDVFEVNPTTVTNGKPVGLLWASPDCRHFSKAKGAAPVSKKVRSLAWVVIKWAKLVRPRVICLENVEEFQTWGPVLENGQPCPHRKGKTFQKWLQTLSELGYQVEFKELTAADFGAPTIRKRLFLIARCDGLPIQWPKPTHHNPKKPHCTSMQPWKSTADCIDWTIPNPSIFSRARPLAIATLERVAKGLNRYIIQDKKPYCAPATSDSNSIELAFIVKNYTGIVGSDIRDPLGTITTVDHHSLVTIKATTTPSLNHLKIVDLLAQFNIAPNQPFIQIKGQSFYLNDITLRMLAACELFTAQGFPNHYIRTHGHDRQPINQTNQKRLVGNSVSPPVAQAIVRANFNSNVSNKKLA